MYEIGYHSSDLQNPHVALVDETGKRDDIFDVALYYVDGNNVPNDPAYVASKEALDTLIAHAHTRASRRRSTVCAATASRSTARSTLPPRCPSPSSETHDAGRRGLRRGARRPGSRRRDGRHRALARSQERRGLPHRRVLHDPAALRPRGRYLRSLKHRPSDRASGRNQSKEDRHETEVPMVRLVHERGDTQRAPSDPQQRPVLRSVLEDRATMTPPRRVALADLLSGPEAAQLAGVTYSHLRVLLAREQFPAPVRTEPSLWLRADVAAWKTKG